MTLHVVNGRSTEGTLRATSPSCRTSQRHYDDLPKSVRRCRGRSEQVLELLVRGPRTPYELFDANRRLEEAEFLGDDLLYRFLEELEHDGLIRGPLPPRPPFGDHRAFVHAPVELTELGRELV